MVIPIPYGQSYTSRIEASAIKLCRCEACKEEYFYTAQRTAAASGTSLLWLDNEGAKNRATADAQAQIQSALQRAVDPVACPACGWFQPNMVGLLKRRRIKWLLWISLPSAFFILLTGIIKLEVPWMIAAGATAVGGVVVGVLWSFLHDPNRAHGGPGFRDERAASRSRGTLRSVYEAQQAEAQEKLRGEFQDALIRSLLLVAVIDGQMNDAEISSIAQVCLASGVPALSADRMRLDAASAVSTQSETQGLLTNLAPKLNSEGKKLFVKFGICVAAADGPINADEQKVMNLIVQALRMTAQDVQTAIQSMQQSVG